MARTVSIGAQNFAGLRERGNFYVDKTGFVRDWWRSDDSVTLVCRPRRFGKTLALSTVESFFSMRFAGRGEELFGELAVWEDSRMRELQGSLPVVSLSFAGCKERSYEGLRASICSQIRAACRAHSYLLNSSKVDESVRGFLHGVRDDMDDGTATRSLNQLCMALREHHGAAPLVLLDEYDAPMQEAWTAGCWDEMAQFMRLLFNNTFKANPALGRGLMTGVTRIASESIFSDLNNIVVVTITSDEYAADFGFTQDEVFAAMDELGLDDREGVRAWYDGFTFGQATGIYNPWSITCYLKRGQLLPYWANTSSNSLVSALLSRNDRLKRDFEDLLKGNSVKKAIREQVTFRQLWGSDDAAWSLLLAAGYLRADAVALDGHGEIVCDLSLTNHEMLTCFELMVLEWFGSGNGDNNDYSDFVRALLAGNVEDAEAYLSDVLLACVSNFDGGARVSERRMPERFYHGLVLGLLVELRGSYEVTSNREAGYGRCDVMLLPLNEGDPALAIEFKVFDPKQEKALEETAERALAQVRERGYATIFAQRGIAPERVREYGFGFSGKEAVIR